MGKKILVVCTTDSMIWNFLVPHIQNFQKNGYHVECACSVTGKYFEKLKTLYGISMHAFDFHRSPYNLKNISAYHKLNKFVKENRFDIVFCHEPMGGVMGRLVGHRNGCRVVYMAHGFHFYKGAPRRNWLIYCNAEKVLAKKTDAIITINKEDYGYAQRYLKSKEVFYVPGIGINLKKFGTKEVDTAQVRRAAGIPQNAKWLLTVGELISRKNHKVLIDAIKDMDDVFLTIVGNGELAEQTQAYINENSLQGKVKLLGYRTDIDALNEASDLFVFPSIQEGLPVALMEAMACGKPIVCSAIRGDVDLVDADGGVMFNPYSSKACALAIKKALSSDLKKMGKYNREKIKQFGLENVLPAILDIVSSV